MVAQRTGIVVRDISYVSDARRVAGYLIEREHAKGRPGIVLVHGSGGDRRELIGAAIALAQRGTVALTITEPSTAYPPARARGAAVLTQSRDVLVRDVLAIRRAADVLQSLPSVDPRLIGYLGWSAGARAGAFVAASDSRFRALALLSGGAPPLSAYVSAAPARLRARVRSVLGSIDPLRYLRWARPGTLLLADGTRDTIVPHSALANFARAAPRGPTVRWYRAGHGLDAAAYEDAFSWLIRKLR